MRKICYLLQLFCFAVLLVSCNKDTKKEENLKDLELDIRGVRCDRPEDGCHDLEEYVNLWMDECFDYTPFECDTKCNVERKSTLEFQLLASFESDIDGDEFMSKLKARLDYLTSTNDICSFGFISVNSPCEPGAINDFEIEIQYYTCYDCDKFRDKNDCGDTSENIANFFNNCIDLNSECQNCSSFEIVELNNSVYVDSESDIIWNDAITPLVNQINNWEDVCSLEVLGIDMGVCQELENTNISVKVKVYYCNDNIECNSDISLCRCNFVISPSIGKNDSSIPACPLDCIKATNDNGNSYVYQIWSGGFYYDEVTFGSNNTLSDVPIVLCELDSLCLTVYFEDTCSRTCIYDLSEIERLPTCE